MRNEDTCNVLFSVQKKDPNNAMHDFDQNVITFVSAFKVAPMGLVAKCSTKLLSINQVA